MTKEEKINTLKAIIQECEEYQWQRKETLFEIIKGLEQESVLDKIRAEIEFEVDHRTNMLCAEDVFAILDKYKEDANRDIDCDLVDERDE